LSCANACNDSMRLVRHAFFAPASFLRRSPAAWRRARRRLKFVASSSHCCR
jgi:hypothetical protein